MIRYLLITTILCFVLITGCGSEPKSQPKATPTPTPIPIQAPINQGIAPGLIIENPFERQNRIKDPTEATASVTLMWDASTSDGVTGYNVYLNQGTGFSLSGSVTGLTATITGLQSLVQYSFYVTAFNATDESDPSETVSWISASVLSLSASTGLHLDGVSGWTYEIQQSTDLISWSALQTVKFDSTGIFTIPIDLSQPKMFFKMKRIATQ